MPTATKIEPYDAVVNFSSNAGDDLTLGDPHSRFRLPGQTWTDFLVCLMISVMVPFQKLGQYPISRDKNPLIESVRDSMAKTGPKGEKAAVEQWSASLDGNNNIIIEVIYPIPRRLILQDWGLLNDEDLANLKMDNKDDILPRDDIEVLLRFPSSAYQDAIDTMVVEKNEFGCVPLEASKFDLKKLDTGSVPLVVFFHGGGLAIGSNHEDTVIEIAGKLGGKGIILASCQYALAPEFPFPAAACDACTAVSHFLDRIPNEHKIHIMGCSGGTQMASVSTFECFRRYPGRVASCHLMLPMLNPACDSFSCYVNGKASVWITTECGRWLWCAYLQMPYQREQDERLAKDKKSPSERLALNTNRVAWDKWCETNVGCARLVNPAMDLPSGLDNKASAPAFLIHTNAGDPVRDDGAMFVEQLRSVGARVHHNEDHGTHWWGTKVGTTGGIEKLALAWKEVLFSSES